MQKNGAVTNKLLSLLAFVLITISAVVLSPGFRRWWGEAEIKKQNERSGEGSTNVTIQDKDSGVPSGIGTVQR